MKLALVKRSLSKTLVVCAVVLAAMSGIFFLAYSLEEAAIEDLEKETREQDSIRSKTLGEEAAYNNLISLHGVYKKIPASRKPSLDGYKGLPSRIRASKPIIESLKNRYHIIALDVTFSNIGPFTSSVPTQRVGLFSNYIDLKLKTYTDELVYSFVYALMLNFPGYVKIEQIEIKRDANVNAASIDAMRNENRAVSFVEASIRLRWVTLQGSVDAAKAGGAAPQ